MGREELAEEIRKRMYGEYEPQEIDEDICEHCASIIEEEPHVEMIPEHGGSTEHRVVWCDVECKSKWLSESVK